MASEDSTAETPSIRKFGAFGYPQIINQDLPLLSPTDDLLENPDPPYSEREKYSYDKKNFRGRGPNHFRPKGYEDIHIWRKRLLGKILVPNDRLDFDPETMFRRSDLPPGTVIHPGAHAKHHHELIVWTDPSGEYKTVKFVSYM